MKLTMANPLVTDVPDFIPLIDDIVQQNIEENSILLPTIKHIVIAGGAHMGYAFYGSLKTLIQKKFFTIDQLETIYATSVGSIVAIFMLLQFDWDEMDKYLIERPWHKVFTFDIPSLIKSFSRGGIYRGDKFAELFKPLLLAKDLQPNITLQEFYDYSNVELHFISTKMEGLKLCDISHKTHPDWELIDAVHATSALPILFTPHERENGDLYLDGAIQSNYPMDRCIQDGHSTDEILGVNFCSSSSYLQTDSESERKDVKNNNNSLQLFRYVVEIFFQLWYRVRETLSESAVHIPNQIIVRDSSDKLDGILDTIKSRQKRKYLIDLGKDCAEDFLQKHYEGMF